MDETKALDILKHALLMERRGKAFYGKMAEQAAAPAVREFFGMMAEEEDKHIEILSAQYRAYRERGAFDPAPRQDSPSDDFASQILSDRLKQQIEAATFEAAAIAAAMTMERDAIRVYGARAKAATDPEEKVLYQWLADWEAEHLEFLTRVDRELIEEIWNDNHFWPL